MARIINFNPSVYSIMDNLAADGTLEQSEKHLDTLTKGT